MRSGFLRTACCESRAAIRRRWLRSSRTITLRRGAFGERTLADLAAEFAAVRAATMALVQSLKAEAWVRRGTASGKTVSARALAYIIAGHEVHHRKILDERYFPAIPRA